MHVLGKTRLALLGSFLAALCLGKAASAQASLTLYDGSLTLSGNSSWPGEIRSGWFPVRISASNSGEVGRSVDVEVLSQGWHQEEIIVSHSLTLLQGETKEFEVLVPALSGQERSYGLRVEGGGWSSFGGGVFDLGPEVDDIKHVVYLRRDDVADSIESGWEELLSDGTIKSSGQDINTTDLAVVTWDQASAYSEAYTSLDLVLVSTEHGAPPREVLAALKTWTTGGGQVAFLGPKAEEVAAGAGFDPWLQSRFETPDPRPLKMYSVLHGRVVVLDVEGRELNRMVQGDLPGGHAWRNLLGHESYRSGLSNVREVGSFVIGPWPGIPGLEDLPYAAFLGLLLLFAILIGPANFLAVQRFWKKPPLLLITIPGIALFATIAILLFGILSQGIGIRETSLTSSILDQREHLAATLEQRAFFVGLSAGRGLQPGANTAVFGFPDRSLEGEGQFAVRDDDGQLLGGDYLPSRRPTQMGLVAARSSRARLLFEPQADGFQVVNELGAEVRKLYLRDLDGGWFSLTEELPSEASGRLVPAAKNDCRAELEGLLVPSDGKPDLGEGSQLKLLGDVLDVMDPEDLWPGCYFAVLADNPLRDQCGLEAKDTFSKNVLVGILPDKVEEWK